MKQSKIAVHTIILSTILTTPALADQIPYGATPSYHTSAYGLGSYTANIIFIQDASNTWSQNDINSHKSRIQNALNFWQDKSSNLHTSAQLSFTTNFINDANPLTLSSVGSNDRSYTFVNEALIQLDPQYNSANAITNTRRLNENAREENQTNWAFTIFVKPFTGAAWALFNGPFTIAYNDDPTWTYQHEIAHIFGAEDEYGYAKTNTTNGYLNYPTTNAALLPNGSPNPNSTSNSLMKTHGRTQLNIGTLGQIGFLDSDQDTIPDILDTKPILNIISQTIDQNNFSINFTSEVNPIHSPKFDRQITINTITSAQYKLDENNWQDITSSTSTNADYAFDNYLSLTDLSLGNHQLQIKITNSVDNETIHTIDFESLLSQIINQETLELAIQNFGEQNLQTHNPADLNNDNTIDLQDLFLIRNNFNQIIPPAASIPSPSTALILLAASPALTTRRHNKQA